MSVNPELANIAWQTLLFVSESLTLDKKIMADLRWKQQCLVRNFAVSPGFKKMCHRMTSLCSLDMIPTGASQGKFLLLDIEPRR